MTLNEFYDPLHSSTNPNHIKAMKNPMKLIHTNLSRRGQWPLSKKQTKNNFCTITAVIQTAQHTHHTSNECSRMTKGAEMRKKEQ